MQTPKQMAAGQRRTLMAMKKKLLAMCADWGDVDFYCESLLDQLATDVQKVSDDLVTDAE